MLIWPKQQFYYRRLGPVCISAKKLPHIAFASEWGVIIVVESINIVSRSKKKYNIKKKTHQNPKRLFISSFEVFRARFCRRLLVFRILETGYEINCHYN